MTTEAEFAERRVRLLGLTGRRLGAGERALRGDQELDVIHLVHFWGVHSASVYHIQAPSAPTA